MTQGEQAQDRAKAAEGQEAQVSVDVGCDGGGGTVANGSAAGKHGSAGKHGNVGNEGKPDYQAMIAERDKQIEELRTQIAEAAKSAEVTDKLAAQMEELKAQAADDEPEYALRLAGCRNVRAATALMDEHGGDVEALKNAEPWMFEDAKPEQKGSTGPQTGWPGLTG